MPPVAPALCTVVVINDSISGSRSICEERARAALNTAVASKLRASTREVDRPTVVRLTSVIRPAVPPMRSRGLREVAC